jgi:hypothetical protein
MLSTQTRERIESTLLYTTAAIYLLRPFNHLKVAHAAFFALGTACFLRPRPKETSLLYNGGLAIADLANGCLFWHLKDTLLQIDPWKLKDSLVLMDRATKATLAGALIWGGLQIRELFTRESNGEDCLRPHDRSRARVERNLFYGALFAAALNTSHPKIAISLLGLATTFVLRPDDRILHTPYIEVFHRSLMALTHCVDGYLFWKIAPLLAPKSLNDLLGALSSLKTGFWAASAVLWYGARLYTTAVLEKEKTLLNRLCSLLENWITKIETTHQEQGKVPSDNEIEPEDAYHSEEEHKKGLIEGWLSKLSFNDRKRHHFEDCIKYSALFALCMKDGYLSRSTLLFGAAMIFCLRPDQDSPSASFPLFHAIFTAFNFLDGVFFWQGLVPLASGQLFSGKLSPQLGLWTAGALVWYGYHACVELHR